VELGALELRDVRWRDGGDGLVTDLVPGAWVSIHWDFVCDRLSASAAARLERETRRTLSAVNSSSAGAAALA
jgi:hypothetical protein